MKAFRIAPWNRRSSASPARFPMGGPGDPLLTTLPPIMEAISVHSVVGSVDRHAQLDARFVPRKGVTSRLQGIIQAMKAGAQFPPIEVYRLDGACYVIDGHHRVAAALTVGQIYLDARVTECRVQAGEGVDTVETARVDFAHRTGLHAVRFGQAAGYEQALAQIHEHRWYLCERGRAVSMQDAADNWYQTVYMPVVRHIAAEQLTPMREQVEAGDMYLRLSDLKYQVSSERGHDIGFTAAIRVLQARRRKRYSTTLFGRFLGLTLVATA